MSHGRAHSAVRRRTTAVAARCATPSRGVCRVARTRSIQAHASNSMPAATMIQPATRPSCCW
ncbi:MAG: hypothetical protein DI618_05315 [Dermacoccus nishinomiyaensis]|nr:MAG: hypothetical protein DI618_05315 [Dermacoccus nishinomiyaensis]